MEMCRKGSMLRLCLAAAACFMAVLSGGVPVRAEELSIKAGLKRNGGAVEKCIDGTAFFSVTTLMPGETAGSTAVITNSLSEPVYYRWECASEAANELYDALTLELEAAGTGRTLYSGSLKGLDYLSGPLKPGEKAEYRLVLKLPPEADSSSAGQTADFDILVTFKSSIEADDSWSGSSEDGNGDAGDENEENGGSANGDSGSGNAGDGSAGNDDNGSSGNGDTGGGNSGGGNSGNTGSAASGDSGTNTGDDSGSTSNGSGGSGGSGSSDSGSSGSGSSGSSGGSGSGSGGSGSSGSSGGSSGGGSSGSSGSSGGSSGSSTITIYDGSTGLSGTGTAGGTGSGNGSGSYGAGTVTVSADGSVSVDSPYYTSSGAARGKGIATVSGIESGGAEITYTSPDMSLRKGISTGKWEAVDSDKNRWRYILSDGSYLKSGFALIYNPNIDSENKYCWYYFNDAGIMQIGWIRATDECWYHSHEEDDVYLGALEYGWITGSEDGRLYYTSEATAVMLTGWVGFKNENGGIDRYYFAKLENTYRQNWFFNTSVGRWLYDKLGGRSYGSMYVDEKTPDGSEVDKNGVRVQG